MPSSRAISGSDLPASRRSSTRAYLGYFLNAGSQKGPRRTRRPARRAPPQTRVGMGVRVLRYLLLASELLPLAEAAQPDQSQQSRNHAGKSCANDRPWHMQGTGVGGSNEASTAIGGQEPNDGGVIWKTAADGPQRRGSVRQRGTLLGQGIGAGETLNDVEPTAAVSEGVDRIARRPVDVEIGVEEPGGPRRRTDQVRREALCAEHGAGHRDAAGNPVSNRHQEVHVERSADRRRGSLKPEVRRVGHRNVRRRSGVSRTTDQTRPVQRVVNRRGVGRELTT